MDLAKSEKLKLKIEEFKRETGLDDKEVKQLFIKEYLVENEGKSTNEIFGEWLRNAVK